MRFPANRRDKGNFIRAISQMRNRTRARDAAADASLCFIYPYRFLSGTSMDILMEAAERHVDKRGVSLPPNDKDFCAKAWTDGISNKEQIESYLNTISDDLGKLCGFFNGTPADGL